MKHIIKVLMDLIYLYPFKIRKFKQSYPEDTIIAYGACKGIKLDSQEDVTRGINWALSKRGFFILTNKRIVLGEWEVEIGDIDKAELMKYRSGMVLKLEVRNNEYYHFGLQYIRELLKQDELEITIIDSRVKYSLFSIIIRVFLVAYLVHAIIKLII